MTFPSKYATLLCGGITYLLLFLLLSTALATDESVGNRMAKVFYFQQLLPWLTVACIPLVWLRPFRFSKLDAAVTLYAGYLLLNFYLSDSPATTRLHLLGLLVIAYFLFRSLTTFAPHEFTLAALLSVGAIEALWGLAQLYGLLPSLHGQFRLTGSFFNPGPYAGFLAILFPLALHQALTSGHSLFRILSGLVTGLLLVALPATLSRGAWLAALGGSAVVLNAHFRFSHRLRRYIHSQRFRSAGILLVLLLLFAGLALGSYHLKRDSADGRWLIWKVSSSLIATHPLTGVGFGHFPGAYGEAQAAYFSTGNASPQETLVADAPETAFNEWIQITTEYGFLGLFLFLLVVYGAFRSAFHIPRQIGLVSSLTAYLIFACFSYPFNVLPLLLLFLLLLAQSVARSTPPISGYWPSKLLYPLLLFLAVHLTADRSRHQEAYRRWKSEQTYFNMQIFERTVDHYRHLYPLLHDQPAFLFEYGQCLSRTSQPDSSNHILIQAARLSADPMIWNIMGKNHQLLKQYTAAETAFREAAARVPNRLYPLYLLAKMYAEKGDTAQAIATARLVIHKTPKIPSPATREMKQEMQLLVQQLENTP